MKRDCNRFFSNYNSLLTKRNDGPEMKKMHVSFKFQFVDGMSWQCRFIKIPFFGHIVDKFYNDEPLEDAKCHNVYKLSNFLHDILVLLGLRGLFLGQYKQLSNGRINTSSVPCCMRLYVNNSRDWVKKSNFSY